MGLSLIRAIDDGRLSADGYLNLVETCKNCAHVGSCQLWLARQHREIGCCNPPEFCPIGPELDALRPH